ncbi:YceI family protein [Legionella taurinensis]|uniref:YceI family protein n=1 Tax=Legionella taurinensis TaxID=70611 RepID=A0A3A5LA08_9GAMM|nr:YceI family protein [Legionella taurinensis]RJT43914.1 YceI family protein [Legionella taurinensis]RJT65297.1 YceI family protein [Legionella taurinensis]STY26205.1 putative YceI-like family protein [Legionella taurinensis]
MSIKAFVHFVWMVGLCILPALGLASVPQWIIVPGESQLSFTATQNDAPVSGQFKTFSGQIFVDPLDLASSRIDIVVDMNSVHASYAELKDTLITPDWFNVQLFPQAEFKAQGIQQSLDGTYQTTGTLKIRDKTVPVTLTFKAEQLSADKGIVEGSTVIKRSLFGVGQGEWSSTEEVKDEVTVRFKVVALRKQ